MLQILTPAAMKAADQMASGQCAMPSLVLMENAGRAVVDDIERAYGRLANQRMLVVCGKGNNGGDGLAAARHALMRGASVTVALMEGQSALSPDARTNLSILKEGKYGALQIEQTFSGARLKNYPFRFIIDAVFGTSFHGAVKGKYKSAIEWMNAQEAVRISVDVPSGLDALTGEVETVAVRADRTVTLAALKPGFFFGRGRETSGVVTVADISMPPAALELNGCRTALIEPADVLRSLPVRPVTAHKYSVGKICVIAGSRGLTGAALMSSQSAMRAGAGAVILCVPGSELGAVARRSLEVMPYPVPSTDEGTFALEGAEELQKKIDWADAVVIGPGIGRHRQSDILVRGIIASCAKPLVIDAGGITALEGSASILKERKKAATILTPHAGEFSRLSGIPTEEIERRRIDAARNFAGEYGVVLILKGAPTIVALPDGTITVNSTGNEGMATAGSGDVLSGIVAALAGQGTTPADAARNGVYLHGLAGDLAAAGRSKPGMIASDIIRYLPDAFGALLARRRTI